jgi:sarcosine oxidase, subunit gamma
MGAPQDFHRRTPLRRALDDEGVGWSALADAMIADPPDPDGAASRLGIADLTPLPRLGFKGRGTIPAMRARGIALEAEANRAYRQPDGSLCLVLAASEVVLLSNLAGEGARFTALEEGYRIEDGEGAYPVPRRDGSAWFAVTGRDAPEMFSKLCGVDLRPQRFEPLRIAQTSVARLNAVVVRADLGGTLAFHVLADSASAAYFLDCLRDGAREFDGRLVGVSVLRDLERS